MSTDGGVVHGLRAAAKLTGWSPSGLQKMVDVGRVPAEKVGRAYSFRIADLEAIRRGQDRPGALALVPTAAGSSALLPMSSPDTPAQVPSTNDSASTAQSEPTNSHAAGDEGATASIIFGDLTAGRTLVQIVAERRIAPDVVRRGYTEWLNLSDVDGLLTPTADARLSQAEADVQAIDSDVRKLAAQVTHGRQEVDARLRAISVRSSGASVPGAVYQRLDALEAQLRNLPAAPLPIGHRCPGCGGVLVVAASCSGCGAGRAA